MHKPIRTKHTIVLKEKMRVFKISSSVANAVCKIVQYSPGVSPLAIWIELDAAPRQIARITIVLKSVYSQGGSISSDKCTNQIMSGEYHCVK
jgi:hypothetical protein